MEYKLLKDLPLAKAGTIVEVVDKPDSTSGITFYNANTNQLFSLGEIWTKDISEWLEPIEEKKTYDSLGSGDEVYILSAKGDVLTRNFSENDKYARSETFLTRKEAENENKRREWVVRKDKFIPKENEIFYTQWWNKSEEWCYKEKEPLCNLIVNLGLAFRTHEECEKAIKEHDLIRLFYTIR